MPHDPYLVNRIKGAVRARDLAKVEELWNELLAGGEDALGELDLYLEVAAEVAERGDKERASELLLLLRDGLKTEGREDDMFEVIRRAVGYSARIRAVREDLVTQYRRVYGSRPGFEAVLAKTELAGEGSIQKAVEVLDQSFCFGEGDFVYHSRGWGIGKVVEAHSDTGEYVIDFARRRGQRMEAGMARKALERRSPDDLDVLLWTDKDRVRVLCEEDPLKVLRSALLAAGGKLTSRELREKLTDVLDKAGWTRFWAAARKKAKDDPRIEVGPAPKSLISLRSAPLSRDDELVEKLRKLRAWDERLELIRREALASRSETRPEAPAWLAGALQELGRLPGKPGSFEHQASELQLGLLKDELARVWPAALPEVKPAESSGALDPETGEPLPEGVAEHLVPALKALTVERLPRVLSSMVVQEYRKRTVLMLPAALDGDGAEALLRKVLLDPAPGTWTAAARALQRAGRGQVIAEAAGQIVIKPQDYSQAYAAFVRARLTGQVDVLPERRDGEILAKAIQVLDALALQHKDVAEKSAREAQKSTVDAVRALFNEKSQRVLKRVIHEGSEDEVRRILQLVRQSPALTDTIKRATETFTADVYPALLASRDNTPEAGLVIFTTLEGRRRREKELQHLMEVEFEKVRLEIGRALEFGDISENAELDAARERQQRLADQVARIQTELSRAQTIDPTAVETESVNVGTRVTVIDQSTNEEKDYTILGPWDLDESDPSVVSHLSPMAQGLLGRRPDDVAKIKLPGGAEVQLKVKTIEKAVLQET